jgi:CHAT domain-containing protein
MANNATGNFEESYFLSIPHVSKDSVDPPISQLREHLQGEGRLRDAGALLSIELNFLRDQETQLRACGSLLEACAKAPTSEPLWYVEGRARLLLAQKLRSNGQVSESRSEFQLAKELLQKTPLPAESNHSGLDIRLGELRSSKIPDPGMQLKLWEMFSEQPAVQKDGFMMSTALTQAAEAALEVFTATPSQENREIFWRWQSRQEALLEALGDTYFLYLGHLGTADLAAQLSEDFGAILKWHNEFDATHPNFNLWGLQLLGKHKELQIYVRLKDVENIAKTAQEMNEITLQRDQFWKEDGYNVQSMAETAVRLDAEDGGDSSETRVYKSWFAEWVDEVALTFEKRQDSHLQLGSKNVIKPRAVLNTLVRWLKTASVDGELDKEELVCILVPRLGAAETFNVEMLLAHLTPESLHLDLFGTEASPTSNSRWENVFTILSEWLRNRVTYNETKRHYLLYQLQVDMLDTVVESEDIQIQAQRLVNLVPTLCEEAQQYTRSGVPYWRNMTASAKKTIYSKRQGAPLFDDADPEFIEVLDLYKLSLEEAVKAGNTLGEAATALYIAQLYFWGAMKLEKLSMFDEFFRYLDQSNEAFQKRREGWKVLSGWDKVDKLLKAVSEKLRLQIVPLAVVVLCQLSGGAREWRDTLIWSSIQMGKSIGLGWLMQTNSLDQQALMRNNGALPSTECKEVPIVKPEDLSLITSDAGGDVVYVDWYKQTAPTTVSRKPIVMIVLPSKPPLMALADITWEEVDKVVDKFLAMDEEDLGYADSRKLLRKLNPLVKPLAEHTRPGQVLVFSSIEKLHQMPLHALLVDKEVLIKRNPIVYCSSLTVLDVVFKSRKARNEKNETSSTKTISSSAGFLPKATLFGDPPSSEGRQALLDLSQQLSLKAHTVTDNDFTTSAFQSAINTPGLDLFHYHGHASFEEAEPLDQGLEFDDRRYTLREVFDLSSQPGAESEKALSEPVETIIQGALLSPAGPAPPSDSENRVAAAGQRGGYHATLLGCSSGMSTTTVSSDVVGLVPAFLYAGATSTVSGLWRLDDKDAAIYSKIFYEESFLKPATSGEEKVTVGVEDKEEENKREERAENADMGEGQAVEDTSQLDTPVGPANLESQRAQDFSNNSNPLTAAEVEGAPSQGAAAPHPGSLPNTPPSMANDNRINLAVAHQRAVLAIMDKRPKLVHWAPFVLNGYWMR